MAAAQDPAKIAKTIELLSTGKYSHVQVVKLAGISSKALYNYLKDPIFLDQVIQRSRDILRSAIPDLYKVAKDKSTEGSAQHLKVLLDHIDRLEERQQTSMLNITFTWKDKPSLPESPTLLLDEGDTLEDT